MSYLSLPIFPPPRRSASGAVFTWGLGLLGALGHGHSTTDDFASAAHTQHVASNGSNAAKALAAPSLVRALSDFRVTHIVAAPHATYAIAGGAQRLVFRIGRDTPLAGSVNEDGGNINGIGGANSGEGRGEGERASSSSSTLSLLPASMPSLAGKPIALFAASSALVACFVPATVTVSAPALLPLHDTSAAVSHQHPVTLTLSGVGISDRGCAPLVRFSGACSGQYGELAIKR
jgi:hypothetical protein